MAEGQVCTMHESSQQQAMQCCRCSAIQATAKSPGRDACKLATRFCHCLGACAYPDRRFQLP
jgi:hypothetical protein